MQIRIVTDAEKLELARSHYVDGVPNARIAKQYDVSETTIRNWIKPYKSQFSKEIMQRWYNREERIRAAVIEKMNGMSFFYVKNKYQVTDHILKEALRKVSQNGIQTEFTSKPVFFDVEELPDVENPEPLPKKQNRKPRFGLRNKITGRWVQWMASDGCMRTRLFPSKNAARAYRAKCGVCAEVYEADLFGWENVK